jgi:hypothetical protein
MYVSHPDHRNDATHKSQWSISEPEERNSFTGALEAGWQVDNKAWGFHFANGALAYLGVAEDHVTQLLMAKFVDGTNRAQWHGYPADHQAKNQDRPPLELQRAWIKARVLRRAQVRKLAKGQPCAL